MPVHAPAAPRRLGALAVLTVALLAVLLPAGAASADTVDGPVTASLGSRTGFAPGGALPWASDEVLGRELDLMASSGATRVRLDFDWSGVEHVRGTYDWSNLDRVVGAARRRGLEVLALPAYTPTWARPAGTTSHTPPTDPAGFAAFVAAAAQRYVPQGVTSFEIWNEPNISAFWAPRPDVAAYVRLLELTARAVRDVAPAATIVSGGLSPAVDAADGSGIDPRTFVAQLYATGAQHSFDALGVHPYVGPALPSDTRTAAWNTFQQMWAMRDTMVRAGDGEKKIWMTETGAYTGTAPGAVSEARQAEVVTDALRTVSPLPWAGPLFFYAARDNGVDLTDREDNFGLVHRDFSPKPAWNALVEGLRPSAPASLPAGGELAAGAPTVVEAPGAATSPAQPSVVPAPVRPLPATATTAVAPRPVPAAKPVVQRPAAVAPRKVVLRWSGARSVVSFRVERSIVSTVPALRRWTTVARLGAGRRSIVVVSASPAGRHTYRVIAVRSHRRLSAPVRLTAQTVR